MSFNDGKGLHIVGSASVRSQQYAGDYDSYQVVRMTGTAAQAANEIVSQWQENIKRLRALPDVWIGDIKCGTIPQWQVIPATARLVDGKIIDYNPVKSRAVLDSLERAGVISPAEAEEARALLPDGMDVGRFLQAKQTIKFHVIRWTPAEILTGRKKLRDNRVITLAQAVQLPGIAKMDVIGKVQNSRFTDFSVIYEFRAGGKVLNPARYDIRESLREAVVAYKYEGNYFRMLKRIYALARFEHDPETVSLLTPILNSDLGRLSHVITDIRTLVELLEKPRVPIADIRYEVDQFVGRLSGIYTMTDYLKAENEVIGRLHSATKMKKDRMASTLAELADQLEGYLQYATKHLLETTPMLAPAVAPERPYAKAPGVASAIGKLRDVEAATRARNVGRKEAAAAKVSAARAAAEREAAAKVSAARAAAEREAAARRREDERDAARRAAMDKFKSESTSFRKLSYADQRRVERYGSLAAANEAEALLETLKAKAAARKPRGRGKMTGGGPYTEMLLDEGERVFGTRDIREWPDSARAAYQKAKQKLIVIGPTAGAFTPQQFKLAEIRRFAAAIAAPVNPMYSHGMAVGGPQSTVADLGLPAVTTRPADSGAIDREASRLGLSAATATAAAPAPAPAAAAAPRTPHSKVKMVFDPKPVGRGKMKGGGDVEEEAILRELESARASGDTYFINLWTGELLFHKRKRLFEAVRSVIDRRNAGDGDADALKAESDALKAKLQELYRTLRGMDFTDAHIRERDQTAITGFQPRRRGGMNGGITTDERLYIALRARMEAIDAPMRELGAMRNQLRPIRDNPAVGMNNRRRAGLEMDAIADDMRAHMDAHRAEFLDLRERLRRMPKPDLTPGRPLEGRPYPHLRPPVGKSPLSR